MYLSYIIQERERGCYLEIVGLIYHMLVIYVKEFVSTNIENC